MICPNCKNEVESGVKFCGECGCIMPAPAAEPVAPVVEAAPTTVYCPKCAQPNDLGSRFCMKCGQNLEGVAPSNTPPVIEKENTFDQVEKIAKESAEKAGKLAKKGAKEAKKLAKKGAAEAKKLAAEGAEQAKKLPKPLLIAIIALAAVVVIILGIVIVSSVFGGGSGDAKYALYIKDMEIYASDFKGDPMEVTSRLVDEDGIEKEDMLDAGQGLGIYVAFAENGERVFFPDKCGDGMTLYYRDLNKPKKEATKVDSDVQAYAIDAAGKNIVYLKEGNLYRSDLKNKEKIASDVLSFYITEDLKSILYVNQDYDLYTLNAKGDKEKVAGEIQEINHVSEDLKTVYYTKEDTLYLQQIGKDKVKIDGDVAYVGKIMDSGEVYYTVDDGDAYILCYFDGKESVEVVEDLSHYYSGSYAYDAAAGYTYVYDDDETIYYIFQGGTAIELKNDEAFSVAISPDGKEISFLADRDEDDGYGDLYVASVKGDAIGEPKKVDEEVMMVRYMLNGDQVYFKDLNDEDLGDLYVNGNNVDTDVYAYGMSYSEELGAILYYNDYDEEKEQGTLKMVKGKKGVKISDDVFQYSILNGKLYFLYDYSYKSYTGSLYIYTGNKTKKIDDDVICLMPVYSYNNIHGYTYW